MTLREEIEEIVCTLDTNTMADIFTVTCDFNDLCNAIEQLVLFNIATKGKQYD